MDRDGTINIDSGYTYKITDLRIFPKAIEGLRLLTNAGYAIHIITNQGGIALGYFKASDAIQFNINLHKALTKEGIIVNSISSCIHHPNSNDSQLRECECRKPKTKMLDDIMFSSKYTKSKILYVGNSNTDLLTAKAMQFDYVDVSNPSDWINIEKVVFK